ncbi:MAG: bi-domain-containing oxidoreductase [Actinomycetota bacterium]|nr:bi-domain-containing oxidoreductase [Actinomycetota bacterium]
MKAVLFQPRRGGISVEDVPAPQLVAGRVLIRNEFSLISAGTERSAVDVGHQGLIGKARERPDQARQVLDNVRKVGLAETIRTVNDRLDTPSILGYSCAGTALRVAAGVDDIPARSRVAAAGAGYASHAEMVAVPRNLCCLVPDEVPSRFAAFSTIAAIALQGIHQADAQPGSRVAVVGLGLVGQLTVRLLAAYGYDVVGIDRDESMLALAGAVGVTALARDTDDLEHEVRRQWRNTGADAVLVTAATKSADPIDLAGRLARDRATVVVVGDVLVAPPRSSYYGKELTVRYSRSYGPGRYDPVYEDRGIDYPEGFVAWPLRRNMEEFLRLDARGLDLESLAPVVFPAEEAPDAYALLDATGADRRVAILLSYPPEPPSDPDVGPVAPVPAASPRSRAPGSRVRIAAVGAGSFPTRMLFPHLKRLGQVEFAWLTTGRGITAPYQCRRWGFDRAVAGLAEGLGAGGADAVMVLGPHATHAPQAVSVLDAGLGLFCEKPLALSEDELDAVATAWLAGGGPAMAGFNRRFAPSVQRLGAVRRRRPGPIQVVYRVFAGTLRDDHWLMDPAQGGRILGEVCHFVDLAGFLAGSPPVAVVATSADGTADPVRAQSATIHVTYRDGSTASIVYGGLTPPGAPKELIEVAGDGLAARIDDFKKLDVWSRPTETSRYRGGPKGHAEEMDGFVALLEGRQAPESDFVASLWSTLATCRAVTSILTGQVESVRPTTGGLARALGVELVSSAGEEAGHAAGRP